MLLSNALKKKNRLIKELRNIETDITNNNSLPSVSQRDVDVEKLFEKRKNIVKNIIQLKLKVFVASEPIRENILTIAELKAEITFLEQLSTKKGVIREASYRGSENIEYNAVFDKKEIDEKIKSCEEQIDELQDEIDKHNHTIEIE